MPATTGAGSSIQSTRSILSPSALCHVVLRTTADNYETMVEFYLTILGGRISHKTHRLCFLAFDDEHHRIAILIDPTACPQINHRKNVGLHHVAFGFPKLSNLVTSYEEKKAIGLLPVWCVNHGMTTSMYYKDPDGNQIEFQVDSFDTAEEAVIFMNSPAFEENPVGVDFDPDVFAARVKSGESEASIKLRPNIGKRDRR